MQKLGWGKMLFGFGESRGEGGLQEFSTNGFDIGGFFALDILYPSSLSTDNVLLGLIS